MTVPFDPNDAPPGAFAVPVIGKRCLSCMYYDVGCCTLPDALCLPSERPDRTQAIFRPLSEKDQPVTDTPHKPTGGITAAEIRAAAKADRAEALRMKAEAEADRADAIRELNELHHHVPIDGAVDPTAKKREALRLIAASLGFRAQRGYIVEGRKMIEREWIVL